jgi:hypothetical protein
MPGEFVCDGDLAGIHRERVTGQPRDRIVIAWLGGADGEGVVAAHRRR